MLGRRYAQPLVVDGEANARSCDRDLDGDSSSIRRVLHRVVDEVRQDLPHLVRIGGDLWCVFGSSEAELDHRGDIVARGLHHTAGDLHAVAAPDRHLHPTRLESADPEDVVDDPGEPVGLAGDHLEQSAPLGLPQRHVVATKRERRAVDGGERRAQLVRDG